MQDFEYKNFHVQISLKKIRSEISKKNKSCGVK